MNQNFTVEELVKFINEQLHAEEGVYLSYYCKYPDNEKEKQMIKYIESMEKDL